MEEIVWPVAHSHVGVVCGLYCVVFFSIFLPTTTYLPVYACLLCLTVCVCVFLSLLPTTYHV